MSKHDAPVFVNSFHRSGSTLLMRLLNTNPELLVWGEHGGFLIPLRNSQTVLNSRTYKASFKDSDQEARSVCENSFIPFLQGHSVEAYASGIRSLIRNTVGCTDPNTRWGFKEIRYHSKVMNDWLLRLFPNAQMVFSTRNIVDQCVASLMARWVVDRLIIRLTECTSRQQEETVIQLAVYNTLVRIHNHRLLAGHYTSDSEFSARCYHVTYEALCDSPIETMIHLFSFLRLPVNSTIMDNVARTMGVKAGGSSYTNNSGYSVLDPSYIRDVASSLASVVIANFHKGFNPPSQMFRPHQFNFCWGVMPSDAYSFVPYTGV